MTTNKQLAEFLKPHLSKKVSVTYADGKGAHETTIQQLKQKWFGETIDWKEKWFTNLLSNGVANSNFGGTYTMMPEIDEPTDPEIGHYEYLKDSDQLKSFDLK